MNTEEVVVADSPSLPDGTTFIPSTLSMRFYPDPILHKKAELIAYTPQIRSLASSMLLTMVRHQGIGLAAPQVGISLRMFVVDTEWRELGTLEGSNSYVFINPAIVSRSVETVESVEGCLSFPGETVKVPRAKSIVVSALDINGDPFTLEADGLLAVVIQHEYDHIEGHTFIDNKGPMTRQTVRKSMIKRLRKAGLL